MIYLSIEISKCELYNAEFCNLKIDFLILQIIHQDVCRDDGTGSDGRRILWRTVSQKTLYSWLSSWYRFLLLFFSQNYFYIKHSICEMPYISQKLKFPGTYWFLFHVRERQHSAYFSFLILYLYCTKNKREKIAH